MSVVSRTCDSQVFKASHPLVLSRTLFRGRELSEECSALLLQWVGLWASRHVTVDFDPVRGMGLRAKKDIPAGTILVRGTRELDLEENGWDLVGGGSLLESPRAPRDFPRPKWTRRAFHVSRIVENNVARKKSLLYTRDASSTPPISSLPAARARR